MLRSEGNFIRRFKYDLTFLFFICLFFGGSWINDHPMTFEGEDFEFEGTLPPSIGGGEVLMVAPPPRTSRPTHFRDLDFSFAWYNTLAQEIGTFRLRGYDELSADDLEGVWLLVLPRATAKALDERQVDMVHLFVKRGGSLILEMPGPRWTQLTGIGRALRTRGDAKQITASTGGLLQGDFAAHLLRVPLMTDLQQLEQADLPGSQRNDILLEIDNAPAHIHHKVGEGHVFVLAFDFGMAITALQQGVPRDGLKISAVEDLSDAEEEEGDVVFTEPERAILNLELSHSLVPYADLLERHVLYAPLRYRPAPRLWLFPGLFQGALVMTHPEGGLGDAATFMAEYEEEHGFKSTYFISPLAEGITNDGLDKLHSLGITLGLGWHRSEDEAIYEPQGIGSFRPYRSTLNLLDQRNRLEGWAGTQIHAARVRGHVWDRDYTSTFRKMAYADIRIDSSYGPSFSGSHGYLFGTGLPFYPIDTNGLLLPLHEIPHIISDSSGFGPEDSDILTQLIKESRAGFHQLITLDISADAMIRKPHALTLDTWMRAFELAEAEKHWITTLQGFTLFQEGRRRAALSSRFNAKERTLMIRAELPAVKEYQSDQWLLSPALGIPRRYQGGGIESIVSDGKEISLDTLGHSGDGILVLLPVRPGVQQIFIRYASVGR